MNTSFYAYLRRHRTLRHIKLRRYTLHNTGVTLVELMVVIAIVAILAAIAVPNLQSFIASSRLKSATNDVVAGIAQVRSLAIKDGTRVTMCKSSNGTQCATTGDWEQGWITFVDPTRNSPFLNANVDSGESVLFYEQAVTGTVVIKGNTTVNQYVSYSADGLSRQLNGGFLAGTIRVCSTSTSIQDSNRARDIVISSVGRVVVSKVSTSSACNAPS